MTDAKSIVRKWYAALGFPTDMDAPFTAALDRVEIAPDAVAKDYDVNEEDGEKNLVYFLYFSEALSQQYKQKGIPEEILIDTLHDIVVWTKTWSSIKGGLYLGELSWLKRHLTMQLFKLGRLQFCMAPSEFDIPLKGVKVGTPVIEVHIPEGEPLYTDACLSSLNKARAFFAQYYPEYTYTLFTCHSWLLDTSLSDLLPEGSNILSFARLFTVAREDVSDAILSYLFRWKIKKCEIENFSPASSLAAKVKAEIRRGRCFYETLGYIEAKTEKE